MGLDVSKERIQNYLIFLVETKMSYRLKLCLNLV